jgi:hypothetical protein
LRPREGEASCGAGGAAGDGMSEDDESTDDSSSCSSSCSSCWGAQAAEAGAAGAAGPAGPAGITKVFEHPEDDIAGPGLGFGWETFVSLAECKRCFVWSDGSVQIAALLRVRVPPARVAV